MNQIVPEIVRIGVANARIQSRIFSSRVKYLNEAGQKCFVDLEECARNMVQMHYKDNADAVLEASLGFFDSFYTSFVGQNGLLEDPPWVEFMNERRTRFEFGSEQKGRALLRHLRGCGWRTQRAEPSSAESTILTE